jgi:hypothetical protein
MGECGQNYLEHFTKTTRILNREEKEVGNPGEGKMNSCIPAIGGGQET